MKVVVMFSPMNLNTTIANGLLNLSNKNKSELLKEIALEVFMKREDFTIDLIVELMNKAYDVGFSKGSSVASSLTCTNINKITSSPITLKDQLHSINGGGCSYNSGYIQNIPTLTTSDLQKLRCY